MLSDQPIKGSVGSISAGIEPDGSVKAVVDFVKDLFHPFAEKNKALLASNEKGLNQKLCIFLNQHIDEQPFFFHPEFMEDVTSGNSAQVDIGTINKSQKVGAFERQYNDDEDSFFSMEAKRLPTTGTNREREYVIGYDSPCGAMERFKKGIHGPRLKYAAIIGYIQGEDFNHWFLQINSWVEELAKEKGQDLWSYDDKIKRTGKVGSGYQELNSINSRTIGGKKADKINIIHFWINLVANDASTT